MTIGTCPACGKPHAVGAQTCSHCGEPLTNVARVLTGARAPDQPRWLAQTRQRATDLRRSAADASDQRMEALRETDRRRIAAEQAVAARTQARERRAVLMAGVVVLVMLGIAGLIVLAMAF